MIIIILLIIIIDGFRIIRSSYKQHSQIQIKYLEWSKVHVFKQKQGLCGCVCERESACVCVCVCVCV